MNIKENEFASDLSRVFILHRAWIMSNLGQER